MVSRRRVLSLGLSAVAIAKNPHILLHTARADTPAPLLNPISLQRFVDPLPIPVIASSTDMRASPHNPRLHIPYYRIEMREFEFNVHRDLPPTRQWGYQNCVPGPTFETRSGEGLLIEWVNALPKAPLFTIDHTIHGAEENKAAVRTIAHVHGAKVPPESDGYPEDCYAVGKSRVSYYPNAQDAAFLWYHDHAMGITRLNVYAGLLGAFIVRDSLEDSLQLPKGDYEIPLILYDRNFSRSGQLSYPVSNNPASPWVSEVYGNTTLVNGKIYPYVEVEPRKYRLRVLNAANTRHFNLFLGNGQAFEQIGSDQGLLPAPVSLKNVLLFPAERADLIVDFSGREGSDIRLKNQSDEILSFRVLGSAKKSSDAIPRSLRPIVRIPESSAVLTRTLTLNDHGNHDGNSMRMLLNNMHWNMPVTEKPVIDTVEIWSLVNLTDDTHPIHPHLVRLQILDRRPFDIFAYNANGEIKYTGVAVAPPPNEAGWKDTVRVDPGTVTRIVVRFEGFTGRYVWHCHLLEHEDNEMMRPYEVVTSS